MIRLRRGNNDAESDKSDQSEASEKNEEEIVTPLLALHPHGQLKAFSFFLFRLLRLFIIIYYILLFPPPNFSNEKYREI